VAPHNRPNRAILFGGMSSATAMTFQSRKLAYVEVPLFTVHAREAFPAQESVAGGLP
jgi:hypothetical protein